jgi:hypothetical protein
MPLLASASARMLACAAIRPNLGRGGSGLQIAEGRMIVAKRDQDGYCGVGDSFPDSALSRPLLECSMLAWGRQPSRGRAARPRTPAFSADIPCRIPLQEIASLEGVGLRSR